MRPGNNPMAVRLPKIHSPPRRYSLASDSSAAEDPPQYWLPQTQSYGEPHGWDALHRAGENWSSSSPPRGHRSCRPTSSSPSGAKGARSPVRAHAPAEPGPAASARPTRYWLSSPREQEGDQTESLYSVEEERDDSFTAVLDFIRRSHDLEKPAGVAPSRGKTTVTRKLGLQAEPTSALNLPPSPLVAALVDTISLNPPFLDPMRSPQDSFHRP